MHYTIIAGKVPVFHDNFKKNSRFKKGKIQGKCPKTRPRPGG